MNVHFMAVPADRMVTVDIPVAVYELMQMGCQSHTDNTRQTLHLPELNEVRIEDAFWSPKLDIWRKITANDVLNKFEGKYTPFTRIDRHA